MDILYTIGSVCGICAFALTLRIIYLGQRERDDRLAIAAGATEFLPCRKCGARYHQPGSPHCASCGVWLERFIR